MKRTFEDLFTSTPARGAVEIDLTKSDWSAKVVYQEPNIVSRNHNVKYFKRFANETKLVMKLVGIVMPFKKVEHGSKK